MTNSIEEFDKFTGMEQLRAMMGGLNNCQESFLDRYKIPQLIKIYRMWLKSAWDFAPDTWTERQLREALKGIVPNWNDDEKPIYIKRVRSKPKPKDNNVCFDMDVPDN